MPNQEKEEIPLLFPQAKEEEITSIFLVEDLIKEYNNKILTGPSYLYCKKYPLSLRSFNANGDNLIIYPMTKEEHNSMRFYELQGNDWTLLKKVFENQVSPKGLISNIPTLVAAVSIAEVINELGLKGKVYYKALGDKTYVILKGYAGERSILQGTRYLNTHPQIAQFGLAKVSVKTAYKTGFKTSIWVYGSIKTVEAVEMLLKESELKPSFFSEIGTDMPKLAITSLVAAAAGGVVAATSLPVAVGAGVVLVVGFGTGVALDYLDQKIGLTEKLNEAVEKMWVNLKKSLNILSSNQEKPNISSDLLEGFVFEGSFIRNQRIIQKGDLFVYTA